MLTDDRLILRKEVDWSLLVAGLTLPHEAEQAFIGADSDEMLRGEYKYVFFVFEQKKYKVKLVNVNFQKKTRGTDTYQIRYSTNGELGKILQSSFSEAFEYFISARASRAPGDRTPIKLPEDKKDYLKIYATKEKDVFEIVTELHQATVNEKRKLKHRHLISGDDYSFLKQIKAIFEYEENRAIEEFTLLYRSVSARRILVSKINAVISEIKESALYKSRFKSFSPSMDINAMIKSFEAEMSKIKNQVNAAFDIDDDKESERIINESRRDMMQIKKWIEKLRG